MVFLKDICWALIFITWFRFPPGISIAEVSLFTSKTIPHLTPHVFSHNYPSSKIHTDWKSKPVDFFFLLAKNPTRTYYVTWYGTFVKHRTVERLNVCKNVRCVRSSILNLKIMNSFWFELSYLHFITDDYKI